MPFIALIIGPYSSKGRSESLCKVFHLVREKTPYSLNFKQIPSKKLKKGLMQEIKEILVKYANHQDLINLKEMWAGQTTREEKLMETINIILEKNMRVKDTNAFNEELRLNLSTKDYNSYF